jgi:tripartite-type tricarboxylate transporter receptor subunit TctC
LNVTFLIKRFTSSTFGAIFVKSGRIVGLGIAGKERVSNLPDLPTFYEQNFPGYDVVDWKALAGPKGMASKVVVLLNTEVNAILREKSTRNKFEADGTKLVGGTPEQMLEIIHTDINRWRHVVENANIKVE